MRTDIKIDIPFAKQTQTCKNNNKKRKKEKSSCEFSNGISHTTMI